MCRPVRTLHGETARRQGDVTLFERDDFREPQSRIAARQHPQIRVRSALARATVSKATHIGSNRPFTRAKVYKTVISYRFAHAVALHTLEFVGGASKTNCDARDPVVLNATG